MRESLSSNHLSTDDQLRAAVRVLEQRDPLMYRKFLEDNEGYERAMATITGTSSWIDCEAAGVDDEFSSWCIEWLESFTPIYWDDGEPWWTTRGAEITVEINPADVERFWQALNDAGIECEGVE